VIDLGGAWVMGLAFSPDGCCLATVSVEKGAADRTHTEVWGIATRKRLLSLPNRQPGDAIQFAADGRKIVVASRTTAFASSSRRRANWTRCCRGCRFRSERLMSRGHRCPAGHTDRVRDIAISPDGSRIASASGDQTVRIGTAPPVKARWCSRNPAGSGGGVRADGRSVAAAGQLAKVWDISRHTAPVHGVAFSADGKVVDGGADGIAKIWDVSGDLPVLRFTAHKGEVIASHSTRPANAWRRPASTTPPACGMSRPAIPEFVAADQLRDVAFSPDGSYLATASADGHARLYRWNEPGAESNPVLLPKVRAQKASQIMAVAFHPGDATLVTVSSEGLLKRWSRAGEELGEISLNGCSRRRHQPRRKQTGGTGAESVPVALGDLVRSTANTRNRSGCRKHVLLFRRILLTASRSRWPRDSAVRLRCAIRQWSRR
jgi:WD40 repeat protein